MCENNKPFETATAIGEGFSFGTPTTSASTGFTFGTLASSSGTGFTSGAQNTAAPSTTSSSGFSYGMPTASTASSGFTFGTTVPTSSPGFAFGQPATATTSIGFTLGNSTPTTTSGFSFGSATSTQNAALPFGTTAPASTGFSFGATPTTTATPGFAFASTAPTPATTTLGGGFNFGTPATSVAAFGFTPTTPIGTVLKFNPVTEYDTVMRGGVSTSINTRLQCITGMNGYLNKSLEELRVEDYAANRKRTGRKIYPKRKGGPGSEITCGGTSQQTGGAFHFGAAASTFGFSFSNTTQSKALFGATGTTEKEFVNCAVQTEVANTLIDKENAKDENLSSLDSKEKEFVNCAVQTEVADAVIDKEDTKDEDWSSLDTKGVALLSERMKALLIKGRDHDVKISVKDKEFPAHRSILSARSPVFAMMLTHDTKENNTSTISIEDCDPEIFNEFLLFVYSGRTENLTPSNALQLYYIADKYDFPVLKERCMNMMKASLSITSICDVVLLAAKHQEQELFEVATEFFAENVKEILVTASWVNFMSQNPVEANELYIKSMEILLPKK